MQHPELVGGDAIQSRPYDLLAGSADVPRPSALPLVRERNGDSTESAPTLTNPFLILRTTSLVFLSRRPTSFALRIIRNTRSSCRFGATLAEGRDLGIAHIGGPSHHDDSDSSRLNARSSSSAVVGFTISRRRM